MCTYFFTGKNKFYIFQRVIVYGFWIIYRIPMKKAMCTYFFTGKNKFYGTFFNVSFITGSKWQTGISFDVELDLSLLFVFMEIEYKYGSGVINDVDLPVE
jgi:hypothetical protein